MVSGECTDNRQILPKSTVRCRVIVVCETLGQAKLASHNNDAIMATDVEELVVRFFCCLHSFFSQCRRSQCNRDPLGSEHCKDKWEDYILIVVAMKAVVDENTVSNPSLGSLLDNMIAAMEREIEQLTEVLDSCPTDDLKFLRKLAEFRILFFVVEGFTQTHPKVLQCYKHFSPVSLNCSICSLVMLYAGLPPVLGNDEIAFLTSSEEQLSTTT